MARPEVLQKYLNPMYDPNPTVIWPSVAPQSLVSIVYSLFIMIILMQFVCIVGFDWLLFYVKFSIYKSYLRG